MFDASLGNTKFDAGSHPCEKEHCSNIVPYDDEPYCFIHSPDSGSHDPGYSYAERQALPHV